MIIQSQIKTKLTAAFSPTYLEVFDESYKHAGHAGAPAGSSETHIGVVIVSNFFKKLSRIERSRAVHEVIAAEIKKIHALTVLNTMTPEEYDSIAHSVKF